MPLSEGRPPAAAGRGARPSSWTLPRVEGAASVRRPVDAPASAAASRESAAGPSVVAAVVMVPPPAPAVRASAAASVRGPGDGSEVGSDSTPPAPPGTAAPAPRAMVAAPSSPAEAAGAEAVGAEGPVAPEPPRRPVACVVPSPGPPEPVTTIPASAAAAARAPAPSSTFRPRRVTWTAARAPPATSVPGAAPSRPALIRPAARTSSTSSSVRTSHSGTPASTGSSQPRRPASVSCRYRWSAVQRGHSSRWSCTACVRSADRPPSAKAPRSAAQSAHPARVGRSCLARR